MIMLRVVSRFNGKAPLSLMLWLHLVLVSYSSAGPFMQVEAKIPNSIAFLSEFAAEATKVAQAPILKAMSGPSSGGGPAIESFLNMLSPATTVEVGPPPNHQHNQDTTSTTSDENNKQTSNEDNDQSNNNINNNNNSNSPLESSLSWSDSRATGPAGAVEQIPKLFSSVIQNSLNNLVPMGGSHQQHQLQQQTANSASAAVSALTDTAASLLASASGSSPSSPSSPAPVHSASGADNLVSSLQTNSNKLMLGGMSQEPERESVYYTNPSQIFSGDDTYQWQKPKYFSKHCKFRLSCEFGRFMKPMTPKSVSFMIERSKLIRDLQNRFTRSATYGLLYGDCARYYCLVMEFFGGPVRATGAFAELTTRILNPDLHES